MGSRPKTLEGDSSSASEPAEYQGQVTINDSGGITQAGSRGSGRESSGGRDVVMAQVVEPKRSTERSFGDLNVSLSDAEESSLLKQRGSESVEKLESVSCNGKKGVRDGVNGGVEKNGTSLDEIEEDSDGKAVIIEAKAGVNGGVEADGSSFDEIEEDPDGKLEVTEDMGDEGHEFSAGDFVWGKIKSHPWWPAQIFDPSDASEYAVKLKPKDRQFLVAYFGDGTFAWCHPSQLKPFEENFQEMSKQSSSKAFVYAVQQAVDEIGRLVKLKMSCGCVEKGFLSGLSQPSALNAGIKEGVLVPQGSVGRFLAHLFEPADLLSELKHVAQVASMTSVLEVTVVMSCLSAFYCSKGGYQLPSFFEAQPIPGFEDDLKGVEVPVQGPLEDWVSSPIGIKTFQTGQLFSQCSHQILEDRQYHRRKQKSIADLMGGDNDIKGKTTDEGIMDKEVALSEKPGKKKRKGSESHDEGNLISELDNDIKVKTKDEGIMAKEVAISEKAGKKKRKGSESHDEGNLISELDKRRTRLSKTPTSTHIKKNLSVENDCSGSKEETKKVRLSRRRKKDESIGMDGNDGEIKEETGGSPISRDGELHSGGSQSDMNGQILKRSLSRERKKSKYLSPPFTNLNMVKRKHDMEMESLNVSDEAQLGEQMTRASANLIGSPQINCHTETIQKKHCKEYGLRREISGGSSHKTPAEDEKKCIDPMKANASTSLVLSEVRSAAVNPSYPIKKKSFEIVRDFISIFRESVYLNVSNDELYKKHQPHKKRSNLESEPVSLGKERNQPADLPESESGRKKIKKSQETKSDKHTPKQVAETSSPKPGRQKSKTAAGTPDLKTRHKKTDEITSPASLFVTFGPGSSLPTKADLIKIYGKFGELNKSETEMFYNNFCARISFVRISDAEEAFNHSQNDSPFGASNVNFRLHNLSAASKIRELSEISNSPAAKSRGKTKSQPVAPQPQPQPQTETPVAGEASQLDFIKHKLEKMTSMLENSDGKVSAVTKTKLESEIKDLLERVSTMVE